MGADWKCAWAGAVLASLAVGCSLETGGLAEHDGGPGMDSARPDSTAGDAGRAEDGGRSECSGPSDCDPGDICCGGTCAGPGCDDGNPCTDDACGPSGCEHTPNADSCDDGVFCNGADICAGGSCSAHAGDPCPGESTCNEAADTCEGCASDAECPADIPGGWDTCRGFDSACDGTGMQERTITAYACSDGTCEASTTLEARTCMRDTDGTACGTPVMGMWGECVGTAGTCSYAGEQTRSVMQPVCSGGACTGSTSTTVLQPCMRDTDGDPCDDGDACTTGEVCSGGSCEPAGATACDDGNVCTADACDPATGSCLFTPASGRCDDGDGCTADRCVSGTCVSECDDGDPCTDDRCHPSMGCQNTTISGCTSG